MKLVELFTCAGGLAIGTAMADFYYQALVECDKRSRINSTAHSSSPLKLRSCTNVIKPEKALFLVTTLTKDQGV